jgi:lipopolysaccharide-binding protein
MICWCCGLSPATNPGLKARVSQPGLNYAASIGVEIMSAQVQQLAIPDQSGTADVTVGKVEYQVKNMKVTQFQPPASTVTINPGSGFTWSLTGATISIHGDWHYKYKLGFIVIEDSGSFDATASGTTISASVAIGASATGEPTISATGSSCHIDQLKLDIHGGASWLYDLFIGFVEDPIRNSLQGQISNTIRDAINHDAARELATLQVKVVIENDWLLDYSLVSAPQFAAGYLESYHKGELFYAKEIVEAPFQPAPLPSPPSTDHMVAFWASEYMLNTAGYVLQKHGVLAYNLTRNDLPADQRDKLNTTCGLLSGCVGVLIPAIGKAFPNAYVEVQMFATSAPVASISETAIAGAFEGAMILRARLFNGSLASLFTMKIIAKVSVTPRLEGTVIKAKLNSMDETLSVTASSIGEVPTTLLQLFFDIAKKSFIIPKLNETGAKGFPLPAVEHIEFYNVGLQLESQCLRVMTDVRYKPSTQQSKALHFRS